MEYKDYDYDYDLEPNNYKEVDDIFGDVGYKIAFLQKVYITLLISIIFALIGTYIGLTKSFLPIVVKYNIAFIILEFVSLILVSAVSKVPTLNLLALFGFTFISGLTLAPMIAAYLIAGKAMIIKEALILTAVIFFGLTFYVFTTKQDFSFLGGFLTGCLFLLIGMGILIFFFGANSFTYTLYSGFGALLFCGFILYDTSKLMREWESDDYVYFAVSLYLDIFNLFLYILSLLSSGDRD